MRSRDAQCNTYILLDVLLCSIAEYFYELCRIKIQTTSKILHNKTSNKRFIIQHAKLLCSWGRTSRVFFYGGMRDSSMRSGSKLAQEIQLTDWSTGGNLSNRSSGVPRDICTRFGRYLYSTRCSWIIMGNNLKDVRANCLCASLLRTQIHMPRHP